MVYKSTRPCGGTCPTPLHTTLVDEVLAQKYITISAETQRERAKQGRQDERGHGTANKLINNSTHTHTQPPIQHQTARLCWRRSANGTQPHFVKRWTVGHANTVPEKSWGRPCPKNGAKKLLHLFGFSMTSRLNGQYLLTKMWHRQSARALKVRRVSYVVAKFHELWSTNGIRFDCSWDMKPQKMLSWKCYRVGRP